MPAELKKLLILPKNKYYETHLSLINCILPVKLTPMEITVLSSFMSLEGDIAQYRFGSSAKKIVMKNCDISPAGLSNYMKSFLDKQFIKEVDGVITIWPLLIPMVEEQTYLFKLQIEQNV